jgi:hypothetical protein
VIRIDTIWLATEPMDMRTGTETALARVVRRSRTAPISSQIAAPVHGGMAAWVSGWPRGD